MDVRTQLREIDEVAAETLDLGSRRQAKETAGSQREGYEKSLREVEKIAGEEEALELAEWIKSEIERREKFPSGRQVRKQGAKICRENGHSVPTGSWLGA